MNLILSAIACLIGAGFAGMLYVRRFTRPLAALRAVVGAWLSVNGLALAACAAFVLCTLGAPTPALAQTTGPSTGLSGAALGAALSTGLACIGAGIAVGIAGAAAIGGITEKPEILGRTLIFVGLAEGIAIYGLIISFMILNA